MRVLIADDHPLFRAGLRAALELTVEVVGEACDGAEAVAAAAELRPDVVVMDLHMPVLNGIEATRQIVGNAGATQTGVLVLTMFEDDESVFAAMRAGARGYLLKGAGPEEIARAIDAVGRGEAIFGPSVARRVIEFLTAPRAPVPFPELTDREREVLECIAQGWTNPRIAAHFVLSEKTVRNHVSNILTKLQVTDRSAAIVRAREAGFGTS